MAFLVASGSRENAASVGARTVTGLASRASAMPALLARSANQRNAPFPSAALSSAWDSAGPVGVARRSARAAVGRIRLGMVTSRGRVPRTRNDR